MGCGSTVSGPTGLDRGSRHELTSLAGWVGAQCHAADDAAFGNITATQSTMHRRVTVPQ
jgi:hypothetical protein